MPITGQSHRKAPEMIKRPSLVMWGHQIIRNFPALGYYCVTEIWKHMVQLKQI
jgi:hypothetical protein